MKLGIRYALALLAVSLFAGCQSNNDQSMNQAKAVAHIKPAQGQTVSGDVWFFQRNGDVKVVADLENLTPNTTHGFHIHEKGDISAPDLKSAGGHFNPTAQPHGGPDAEHHHAGDLGNVKSDSNGRAHLEITVAGISLDGENSIMGRSVIVHEKADDLKTDPSGNSGARIGGGVIEIAK